MCEGTLRNLSLSYWGDGGTGALRPGEWAYFVIYVDPKRFDMRFDTVTVQWIVNDETSKAPTDVYNAMFTANLAAFPRELSQLDSDDPFQQGLLVSSWGCILTI